MHRWSHTSEAKRLTRMRIIILWRQVVGEAVQLRGGGVVQRSLARHDTPNLATRGRLFLCRGPFVRERGVFILHRRCFVFFVLLGSLAL